MGKRLDFTQPHLLRNEAEYEAAVAEIDHLLDLDPVAGSPDYERLEFLSVLVQVYEEEHVQREDASPQEVVDFMLGQHELTRADLADLMGGRSRVSEFFSGKRPLSLGQARALGGYRVHLRFEDGAEGELDLGPMIQFTGVFAPLRDEAEFARLRVDPETGTIVWPNGADLDPDVLYAAVTGRPIDLIDRESARRLARLGGSEPCLEPAPRRRVAGA